YMAPVFVAIEKGFFARENLDFSFVEIESGALGVAAVLSGDAQISDVDPMTVALLHRKRQPLLMFYNLVQGVTLDLVARRDVVEKSGVSDSSSLEERCRILRGLRIGITRPGAPTDVFARYFLERAGLDPDREATLIQVGGVAALDAAFRSGRIDALILSPPLPQTLEIDGVGKILVRNTAGEVPELQGTTLVNLFTSADFAHANGRVLEAYSRALSAAVSWIGENRQAALGILHDKYFSETSPQGLAASLEALWPRFNPEGRFAESNVRRYFDIFSSVGEGVEADASEGVLWTNEFLQLEGGG
ncbi:MAG: ABC transporter substrate-binding protein, partial [Vicinamibacteria bacterium]